MLREVEPLRWPLTDAEIDALGAPVETIDGERFFRLDDANAALEARAALKARKPNCTSGG